MRSIKIDPVETKYWLARCSDHMDGEDCSFESSERAIICHTNPAAYGIYFLIQHRMTSAYKADSLAITCNGSCPTTCLAAMYYEFLAHSAYIAELGDES